MKRNFTIFIVISLILGLLTGCSNAPNSSDPSIKYNDDDNSTSSMVGDLDCEHTFAEADWTITKESSCKEAGYQERKCLKCAYTERQEIPLGAHSYMNGKCSVCGDTVQCSQGLKFVDEYDDRNYSWSAYYVGMGECTDTEVVVPATIWSNALEKEIPVYGLGMFASFGDDVTDITFLGPIMDMPTFFFCGHASLQRVTFAEGQTMIWGATFSGNTSIREVTLPTTLKTIGGTAFSGTSLEEVKLPATLETIGAGAFSGSSLKSIVIPGSVERVNEKTFSNCEMLKDVVLSDGVERIMERAFENCTALERITIPASVERIDSWAFYHCSSLTELDLRCEVTTLPVFMCAGAKSLKTVTMGDKVTKIDKCAFSNCSALETVTFSTSLKTICEKAFNGCFALQRVELPASLTEIQTGAFDSANKLSELVYAGTMEQWNQIELESGWNSGCPATVVQCVDGEIPLVEAISDN